MVIYGKHICEHLSNVLTWNRAATISRHNRRWQLWKIVDALYIKKFRATGLFHSPLQYTTGSGGGCIASIVYMHQGEEQVYQVERERKSEAETFKSLTVFHQQTVSVRFPHALLHTKAVNFGQKLHISTQISHTRSPWGPARDWEQAMLGVKPDLWITELNWKGGGLIPELEPIKPNINTGRGEMMTKHISPFSVLFSFLVSGRGQALQSSCSY